MIKREVMEMANSSDITIKQVLNEKDTKKRDSDYNKYVDNLTPKHKWSINMVWAFVFGGIVCTMGQIFINLYISLGANDQMAVLYETVSLIFLSVVLTGFGAFAKIAKVAGAGVLVPITGFANSVASPAIEFKKEGQVFGVGCKIFTIAGPVILYGIVTTWILGLIYWVGMMFRWW